MKNSLCETVKITPSTPSGKIIIPPSKSMSHRAIICACLADGISVINNIAYSVDVMTTIEGMKALGAKIKCHEDSLEIKGISDFNHLATDTICCNESGSTLRFFIPIFAHTNQRLHFTGKNRLLKRPQKIYQEIFEKQHLYYHQDEEAITIEGRLQPGNYEIDGNVSSQFISGLLFILPLLEKDSTITIRNDFESKSYVLLTIQMLAEFGIQIYFRNESTIEIPGNQHYQAHNTTIEGDYSQFAFFAVLAAINHDLEISGVSHHSLQGDKQILDILQAFNSDITETKDGYLIRKSSLHGSEIDLNNCPDLGPVLCVLAMFANGKTTIKNAKRLRLKESDRILAMESELKKFNCDICSTENEIIIHGGWESPTAELSGWKDHRIVMALSVAATKALHPVIIHEANYIEKSYPAFFLDLKKLGIEVNYLD